MYICLPRPKSSCGYPLALSDKLVYTTPLLRWIYLKLKTFKSRNNGCWVLMKKERWQQMELFTPCCWPSSARREVEVREARAERSLFPFSTWQKPTCAACSWLHSKSSLSWPQLPAKSPLLFAEKLRGFFRLLLNIPRPKENMGCLFSCVSFHYFLISWFPKKLFQEKNADLIYSCIIQLLLLYQAINIVWASGLHMIRSEAEDSYSNDSCPCATSILLYQMPRRFIYLFVHVFWEEWHPHFLPVNKTR